MLKLGKTAARPDAVEFKLTAYGASIPPAPAVFGHQSLIPTWGMLGNDSVGDCVLAGAAHETMLLNREAKHTVSFTTARVLSDYSAITGYDPRDPNTDRGTDMKAAASYRRKTGVIDAHGTRHKVAAYLGMRVGDLGQLASAAYVFSVVGVGIQFPQSAMEQFNDGQPWAPVKGSPIEGGHYVPVVGRVASGNFLAVTWGRLQQVTPAFLQQYMDEAIAYVSSEQLTGGKTPEGFNAAQLLADLKAL